ncbi:permease prefix domain 1-containing protein [uncultured Schumannella sp.]|uniref:permease prefix domain 1-containing protein n=1 Tax=uncultured Schumannella sp. TaxID=1195956 RepID=UPI0025FE942B|nr:permease prefix domain 1-containing protein [uncultured Schumannella sp.]
MTTASTLTDRYVAEALRGMPAAQRADIETELRASIADAIDDLVESGVDAAAAEYDVLTELGAPRHLAAGYSSRPTALIGPELYPDFVRVLSALLATVVPIWFLFSGIVTFVDGATPLDTFGAALFGSLELAMTIAFFTALVFVIIERTPAMRSRQQASWSPASLPAVRDRRGYLQELVGGVILLVVLAGAVIALQTVGAVEGAHGALSGPIEPGLWASGALVIALFYPLVSITFHVVGYYTGWSTPNAVATIVFQVLFVVPAIWLTASGRLLNPDYFEAIDWPGGVGVVSTVVVVLVLLFAVLDAVDGIVRATRSRRTR